VVVLMKRLLLAHKKRRIIIAGALLAIVAAGIVIWHNQPAEQPKVVTVTTDNPSEDAIDSSYRWLGGPDDPKKIIIPELGIDTYIQQVGVDQDKKVAAPDNIFLVGWFNQSQRPGQKGLSVMAGHVTGKNADAIFVKLGQVAIGQRYTVELGSGKQLSYEVTSKQTLPEAQSASAIFSQDPQTVSQLNLVTCSGEFNEQTRLYPDRTIVTSRLVTASAKAR
jgi:sortase (surface protein transpeptidase)